MRTSNELVMLRNSLRVPRGLFYRESNGNFPRNSSTIISLMYVLWVNNMSFDHSFFGYSNFVQYKQKGLLVL